MTISIASAGERAQGARAEDRVERATLRQRIAARIIVPVRLETILIILTYALIGGAAWYMRKPRRRERMWRLFARRWGEPKPRQRFHALRRGDFVRAAGRSALVGVALGVVVIVAAYFTDPGPTTGPSIWLFGVSFMAMLGGAVAFLLALTQLVGALRFRPRKMRLPFTVLSNDVRVGTANFVAYDGRHGVFAGPFLPEPAFAQIYPVVRLLSQAYPDIAGPDAKRERMDEYLEKKGALKLELLDPNGVLLPTGEISILEFGVEGGAEVWRIDVEGEMERWVERGAVVREEG